MQKMSLVKFELHQIFTIAVVIATVVFVYFKWTFYYWKRKGVVHVPATIPFGGAAKLVFRKKSLGNLLKDIYESYKPKKLRYAGFYLFTRPTLVVFDINLVKTILTTDFNYFTDHGGYVNEKHEPLTGHLFNLKGKKWRQLRTKLTPTFTSGKMKMMFHTLVDCSRGLEEVMDTAITQTTPVEIKDVAARYTTDVIGSCAFGLACNSLKDPNSEFRQFGKRLFDLSVFEGFVRFLGLVSPKILYAFNLKFIGKTLTDFFMNAVKQTVEFRETRGVQRNDFMQLLIQLKHKNETKNEEDTYASGLSVEQIAAQSFVFFLAGFETSSTTLTFCLYELVSNLDVQEKLRDEIKRVVAKYDGTVSYEAVMEMPYLDKCIQETLRKYSPLPFLLRECTENYRVPESDLYIEKGTQLFIPILGIHHDAEFYPNPEVFDPERFSPECKAERDHFAWLPFGEGPRACIGLRFGLMQTKVALVALLKDYQFTLNNKTKTPLTLSEKGIMLAAEGGVWMNVQKV